MNRIFAIMLMTGTFITGSALIDMQAPAQSRYTWKHCSPNRGGSGPFYVIAPTSSTGSYYCTVAYLSQAEAINWACNRIRRGNGTWPQLSAPSYGVPQFGC